MLVGENVLRDWPGSQPGAQESLGVIPVSLQPMGVGSVSLSQRKQVQSQRERIRAGRCACPCLFISAYRGHVVQVSNRLFHLVNTLKTAFVPAKNNAVLAQTGLGMLISGGVLYGLTFLFIKLPLSL